MPFTQLTCDGRLQWVGQADGHIHHFKIFHCNSNAIPSMCDWSNSKQSNYYYEQLKYFENINKRINFNVEAISDYQRLLFKCSVEWKQQTIHFIYFDHCSKWNLWIYEFMSARSERSISSRATFDCTMRKQE